MHSIRNITQQHHIWIRIIYGYEFHCILQHQKLSIYIFFLWLSVKIYYKQLKYTIYNLLHILWQLHLAIISLTMIHIYKIIQFALSAISQINLRLQWLMSQITLYIFNHTNSHSWFLRRTFIIKILTDDFVP